MTGLSALWLPILLSAAMVFVVSSVIHMVLPWHKSDYPKLPNEQKVMDALRPLALSPGDYMIPRPSSRQDSSMPVTRARPGGSARRATAWPARVSWSVSARTSRPACPARRTTSSGGSVPSEAVLWVCRSMRTSVHATAKAP